MYDLRTVKSRAARAVAAAVIWGGGLTAGTAVLVLAGAGPAAASETPAMYACAVPASPATGDTATSSMVPMQLAASGPDTMAANDQVSLTSATLGALMADATATAASASLGLEGAADGSIPLSSGMHDGELTLTANWQPTRAGVYRLVAPHRFQVTMYTTKVTVAVVCTTTSVTTATTTVHISPVAMPGASTQGISASQTAPSSAPSAPNTGAGGSLHSPADLALLMAGVVAAAAGVVTMLLAVRRRGRILMP